MAECKMHVGVQGMGTSKIEMEFLRRHGVTHMNAGQAGYRALFYNFCILDHQRTAATLGREL